MTACKVGDSGSGGTDAGVILQSSPTYADGPLSGKIFGEDWTAQAAVVRPFGTGGNQVSLELYAAGASSLCSRPFTSAPFASVVLPADYQAQEYRADITSGTPLVFTSTNAVSKNVLADTAKVKITSVQATGFEAFIYAKATEADGTISEINGKIQVSDCRKVADFSVWDEFAGWYSLVSLDGRNVTSLTSIIQYDTSHFYDTTAKKYVRTLSFPLYFAANGNSSGQYAFGPMEGLGSTTVSEVDGVKTLRYVYNGPINFRGTNIILNFDLQVTKSADQVAVTYKVDIPDDPPSASHSFVLKR